MPREGEAWSGRLADGYARVGNRGTTWQQSNGAGLDKSALHKIGKSPWKQKAANDASMNLRGAIASSLKEEVRSNFTGGQAISPIPKASPSRVKRWRRRAYDD